VKEMILRDGERSGLVVIHIERGGAGEDRVRWDEGVQSFSVNNDKNNRKAW